MRRIFLVLMLSMSMAIVACASNSASSGSGSSNDVKVLNGCKVDAARIATASAGRASTKATPDRRPIRQGSTKLGATANIVVPVKNPKGDEIFEVECGMNTQQQSVSWASIKTGPPVTDDDANYLRGAGYCSEP